MIVAIIFGLVATFMVVWAFNLSFAAHLQEENKAMRSMHIWSFIVIAIAVALIIGASYYASR